MPANNRDSRPPAPEEGTDLPWLRTWRGVYAAVAAVLVVWVWLLTILPRLFA